MKPLLQVLDNSGIWIYPLGSASARGTAVPMTVGGIVMTDKGKTPFGKFCDRQTELNHFLWTTELVYGVVKQRKILDQLPQDQKAYEVFKDLIAEAWFPNNKGEIKYKGTIAAMSKQIDRNMIQVLSNVSMSIITAYEVFVEERFPQFMGSSNRDTSPRPIELMSKLGGTDPKKAFEMLGKSVKLEEKFRKRLDTHYKIPTLQTPSDFAELGKIVTLQADLTKKLRDLYAHKGFKGVPKSSAGTDMDDWKSFALKKGGGAYKEARLDHVVEDVVGGAIRSAKRKQGTGSVSKGIEPPLLYSVFFLTLYSLTNTWNFVSGLDRGFPKEG